MAARVAEAVKAKVAALMESEEVKQRIQDLLKQERAALEDKVTQFIKPVQETTCLMPGGYCQALICKALLGWWRLQIMEWPPMQRIAGSCSHKYEGHSGERIAWQ